MPRNDFINIDGTINYDNITSQFDTKYGINIKYPPISSTPLIGAKGDGTTDDYNAFNNLITYIGLSNAGNVEIYLPSGTYIIGTNLTIPSNISLRFTNGAIISPNTGITVTINGFINAPIAQIFGGAGTIGGTVKNKEAIPQWWGAIGDGIHDDTTAIQQAINTSSMIYFPSAHYLVSTLTISSNEKYLYGSYKGSYIVALDNTSTVFNMTASDIVIRDLKFTYTGTRTGGTYISSTGSFVYIDRCFLENGCYGIISSSTLFTVSDCDFRNFAPTNGILIQINAGYNVYLNRIRSDNPVGSQPYAGINIINTGDTTLSDCNIIHSGSDLLINPNTNQTVASLYASNCFFDTAVTGINMTCSGTGAIIRSHFINCWTSSHSNRGVVINGGASGTIDGVTFINHQANLCTNDGIQLIGGNIKNIYFIGGECAQNTGSGLTIGTNIQKFYIYNMLLGAVHNLNGNAYGIYINTGCSNYDIENCVCVSNTSGQIVDTSNTGRIINCTGYVTKNSGSATVSSGQTTVLVTHGLNITPLINNISVTPTNSMGNATKYYISNVTSTQFIINVNIDPGVTTATFVWQITI